MNVQHLDKNHRRKCVIVAINRMVLEKNLNCKKELTNQMSEQKNYHLDTHIKKLKLVKKEE